MKQFNKTLIAAALMVAAGSANADISTLNDASELYMSVYDTTSKNTYSLDTNLTLAELLANVSNTAYSYSKDLSTDANWTSFTGGTFNAATTVYGLVVASYYNPDMLATSSAVGGLPISPTDSTLAGSVGAVQSHAGEINVGLVGDSKVVNDGGTSSTGQFNDFNTLFSSQTTASVAAAYGSSVGFFHETAVYDAAIDAPAPVLQKFAGEWKLAGNTLSFAAPAVSAVPLPAAVWMFGAGLMGMLRLNRRKSMAV